MSVYAQAGRRRAAGSAYTHAKPLPKSKKGGTGGWLRAPLRVADAVVDDAKSLAVGVPRAAWETGKASVQLVSPASSLADRKRAAVALAGQAADVARGVEEIVPNPRSLPYGDVSLVQIGDGKVRFWVRGGEADDSRRAAKAWEEHPLTSALTAIGVVAPAAGAISVGRLAAAIRKANRTMSRARALELARLESRNPGYLAAQGIKGGLEPRLLRSRVAGGKTRTVELPQARSAVGRRGQEILDTASRAVPDRAWLSERRRANRQLARELDEQSHRAAARAANLIEPVREVAFGRAGRARKGDQTLLAYALQTPKVAGDPLHGPRAVAARLDEIIAAGRYTLDGETRLLSPADLKRLTAERNRLRKALADPPPTAIFAAAVDALEQVSRETTNIARYITQGRQAGVSPETAARLDKIFADRRNLLARYLGLEGEARGYMPHRTSFQLREGSGTAGLRGAGSVVGTPRPTVNMHHNELRLFHQGKLSHDPRLLEQAYTANQRFLDLEQARRELFDEAVPLERLTGSEGKGYLVRDPDRSPASLTAEQRALSDPRRQALELLDQGDEDRALEAWRDSWLRRDTERVPDEWQSAPESVRWLPADVVEKRLPRRVAVDPDARFRPIGGTLNALARVATITGKPARYVATNTVQNMLLALLTNPTAVFAGVRSQAALVRSVRTLDRAWFALRLPDGLRARRPDLYRLAASESGDVTATAGLPHIRPGANLPQKAERAASLVQHTLGEALGSVADTPYRVAVWLKHAKRYGYRTDRQLERLLTADTPELQRARRQVLQATRDDMFDFNRLSAMERDTISRYFFLWPLVRAGVRWPVTYTRDYPVRAGAAAALTLDDEPVTDVRARDLFKFGSAAGQLDTGWAMPHGITVEQLENLQRVMHGDLLAVGGMTAPQWRELGRALFGYQQPFGERATRAARSLVPGFAAGQDIHREGWRGIPAVSRFTPQPERKNPR